MFHTTPESITDEVSTFCKSISSEPPVYIELRSYIGPVAGECFNNVTAHVRQMGGDTIYGWIIWYHPGVFIEAENHAVWRSPEGELVDFTPVPSGETRILFLPDPNAKPHAVIARNSKRKALSKDDLVKRYVESGNKVGQVKIDIKKGKDVGQRVHALAKKHDALSTKMRTTYGDAYPIEETGTRLNYLF